METVKEIIESNKKVIEESDKKVAQIKKDYKEFLETIIEKHHDKLPNK